MLELPPEQLASGGLSPAEVKTALKEATKN
jgi:hypothetical protein